jgi:hypothetical protein
MGWIVVTVQNQPQTPVIWSRINCARTPTTLVVNNDNKQHYERYRLICRIIHLYSYIMYMYVHNLVSIHMYHSAIHPNSVKKYQSFQFFYAHIISENVFKSDLEGAELNGSLMYPDTPLRRDNYQSIFSLILTPPLNNRIFFSYYSSGSLRPDESGEVFNTSCFSVISLVPRTPTLTHSLTYSLTYFSQVHKYIIVGNL